MEPASGGARRTGVVMVEVVCVVTDEDLPDAPPQRAPGQAEFPWFFGPGDGSVVDGSTTRPVTEPPAVER